LHDAPVPPWGGRAGQRLDALTAELDDECERLVADGVLPADLVARNREIAKAALRPWIPVFTHGDLHIAHVFVEGDEITGIIDWSEAGRGDLDVIRAWWSLRTLRVIRWLTDHGYDPFHLGGAVDVLLLNKR
jgi:aminoglycoside phosphotransferase (APT) family kinase protein